MVKLKNTHYTKTVFIADFSVRSMIHALVLRSPSAEGVITEMKCPKMPNSYTFITAKDIPGINELDEFPVPVLASQRVSYIGEAVGILTGPDILKLEEYASQCAIVIDKEPLPEPPNPGEKPEPPEKPCFLKLHYHSKEQEPALPGPRRLISGSYTTGIQEHWYSEPHAAAAVFADNKLTVHTATQWPFHVKRSLSKVLNIPDPEVEIIQTELAFHLDGKLWYPSLVSCHAALAALVTGKYISLKLTRIEDFRWSPKRSSGEVHMTSSLGEKGEVLNTEINTAVDMGSQGVFVQEILNQTCLASLGIYRLGRISLEGTALKTGKPPQGPLEGFGMAQGFFASERHVSLIADSLRQDPAEWRKNNCLTKQDSLAIGVPLKDGVPMTPLIDSVALMSDYYRKWASYELLRHQRKGLEDSGERESRRGIGIAAAYQGSGFLYPGNDRGVYSVELTLEKDSSLIIKTSVLPEDEETSKIWHGLASSILGIDENHVTVTGANLDSGPVSLSRTITVITRLVERCCEAIRKQRFRDPLPITVRRNVRPGKFLPWNGENGGQNADTLALSHPAWGAAVTEVEIDHITLEPKIRGVWLVAEGGKILSQSQARRTLKNAAINALSWSTGEYVFYRDGQIPQEVITNYNFLAPLEIPPIHIDFLWNDTANPKGIGELPYSCIPASFVQAVSQAMNYPFAKIPLSAEDIWEVKKTKEPEGTP